MGSSCRERINCNARHIDRKTLNRCRLSRSLVLVQQFEYISLEKHKSDVNGRASKHHTLESTERGRDGSSAESLTDD